MLVFSRNRHENLRMKMGLDRIMIDDEVNYKYGGLFTVRNVDWDLGYIKIYTRSKPKNHPHYKEFWTYINNVCLAGTFLNKRRTKNIIPKGNKKECFKND